MCGGCGQRAKTDSWTQTLGSRRAQWEVARLLNAALARAQHPGRVQLTNGSWVVRTPTGASRVATTVTDVVTLLVALAPISAVTQELREGQQTPVAAALGTAVWTLA